ncbi:MAG: polysaccharide pyruvyl transferase family protein [Alkalibacterium sp.]|nr:polysaccharide pyruvyl transferase family protein [Alkalibacterium sp.]
MTKKPVRISRTCSLKRYVILLDRDISSLEFDILVEKLDFIIGSRFHSIVHSYKNHVPCIAIGWATKYHELLKLFGQYDYMFDVRESLDKDERMQRSSSSWAVIRASRTS